MENKKNILINGLSMSWVNKKTGIEEFTKEIIYRLDKINNDKIKFYYIYDKDGPNKIIIPNELVNIECIPVRNPKYKDGREYKENLRFSFLWRSKLIRKYAKKFNAIVFCPTMSPIICKNQIPVIHDIRPRVTKFDSFVYRLKHRIYLKIVKHCCKKFLTVSNYQKDLISKYLKIKKDNITVIYPGYEQISNVVPDMNIFSKYPNIKPKEYYYALGSLAPHKNFKWIIEVAKRNPQKTFVIAGGKDLKAWEDNIEVKGFENLIFTGYVTDEENKALYLNCKGFLQPSKFEGFGTPPLEALSLGASVAVANATCLPEIYEDCVHYFDPDDYDIDLDLLFSEKVASPEKVLKKCNWKNYVETLYNYFMSL